MRAAALLLPLALAACTPRQDAANQVVRSYGLEPVSVTATDWWSGPCEWTEPYTARFLARAPNGVHEGVICATGERAEGGTLRKIKPLERAREPDLFEGGR